MSNSKPSRIMHPFNEAVASTLPTEASHIEISNRSKRRIRMRDFRERGGMGDRRNT